MYRAILIYFLTHQVTCFMHDPPVIRSSLIEVSNMSTDQNSSDTSLLNELRHQIQLSESFDLPSEQRPIMYQLNNETDELKHDITKRDVNDFSDYRVDELNDVERIKLEFEPFIITRASSDAGNKEIIREYIISKFTHYRMKTYKQPFQIVSVNSNSVKKGVNLFSYYPSQQRKRALKEQRKVFNDQILVMGAHYDTVDNSPGIDDNASGIVNILELARLLNVNKVNLNYTIIFVCFDFEELGLHGSKAFVDKFLIPIELVERQSQYLGAYITDMLLNFNDEPNSQSLPSDIKSKLPKTEVQSEQNEYRCNYIAIWSRRNVDRALLNRLREVWNKSPGSERFKLFSMDPRLPSVIRSSSRSISDLGTFIRSDHAQFWYPKTKNFDKTLTAVLLTDLGPWRSPTKICYHKDCDNSTQLTNSNLEFFLHTNQMLYKVLTENPPTINDRQTTSNRIPRVKNMFHVDSN